MSHQNESATRRLQLTPQENDTLVNSLDQAPRSAKRVPQVTLQSVQEKLEDAGTVALWLRENVTLDLSPNELQVCLQALDTALKGVEPTDEHRAGRELLRERLAQALIGDDGVLPGIDCPLHATCLTV